MPQKEKQTEPIKKYYIAYVDLLGYKQFFQSYPDKAERLLQVIYEAISDTKNYSSSSCITAFLALGQWHSRGLRFDPAYLHQKDIRKDVLFLFANRQ